MKDKKISNLDQKLKLKSGIKIAQDVSFFVQDIFIQRCLKLSEETPKLKLISSDEPSDRKLIFTERFKRVLVSEVPVIPVIGILQYQ